MHNKSGVNMGSSESDVLIPTLLMYSYCTYVKVMFWYVNFEHGVTFCDEWLWMQNAVEQPPKFVGRWIGTYTINVFVVVWVFVVGFGFGGWASVTNFVHQIDTFGLFTKCFQCPPPTLAPSSVPHLLNATAPAPLNHTHLHHPWRFVVQNNFCWVSL